MIAHGDTPLVEPWSFGTPVRVYGGTVSLQAWATSVASRATADQQLFVPEIVEGQVTLPRSAID
jgi:hypothetical protein